MNSIKQMIRRKIAYFNDENISIEMKNYHLVEIYAVFATAIMGIVFLIAGLNPMISFLVFVLLFLILLAGYVVKKKGEYRRFTILYCVTFNFICYPLFYYLTGDLYNGSPLYFAMGIILTFFLIRGKSLVIMVILELLWYAFLFYDTYVHREALSVYRNHASAGEGIAACFVLASALPVFIIFYQTVIYKKTHDKIQQANLALSSAGMGKSRFLANMTHEIRTPMNAIMGMIEMILKEDLTDEAREQAETIRSASSDLLAIINNILVYSKLDSKKMELLEVRYDFKEMIDEVIHSVIMEYAADSSEFSAFVDHTIPKYLYGDDIRIKQVFRYLLFSSIRQLPHGRISLEISGERNETDHTITLKGKICETGKGLTESELNAIFGAYNEYDSRQRSDFKGMGLELFVCREILNLMGGSLKIESVEGIGMAILFEFTNYILSEETIATIEDPNNKSVLIYLDSKENDSYWMPLMENFKISPYYATTPGMFKMSIEERKYTHIFIPDSDYDALKKTIESAGCEHMTYVVTDYQHVYEDFGACRIIRKPVFCLNVSDVLNDTWNPEEYSKASDKERISYPDAKVLVVDDNIVNLKVVLNTLKTYGITADMATSGEGCLNILSQEKYDLLLLDQLMPNMSGPETIHELRRSKGINASIPAICITAEFGADVRERLIAEGFQDYIAKPIKDYYLDRILRQYLPQHLVVIQNDQETEDGKPEGEARESKDPLLIDTKAGIDLVNGNEKVYHSILNAYYKEGLLKLEQTPQLLAKEDLTLYTTTVHALKSSSASIGAMNLSERFKELEVAGKKGDRAFIERENEKIFGCFERLLKKVKEYLVEKQSFEDDHDRIKDEKEISLRREEVEELLKNLNSVNLKYCEDKILELTGKNYGEKNNDRLREIRKAFEKFDYREVKTLLNDLLHVL
ncbi:MAG: response regulator [Lachnospiraceae bacterium]|nr:response regulator [Lachnospiraceae bacterium]